MKLELLPDVKNSRKFSITNDLVSTCISTPSSKMYKIESYVCENSTF